MGTTMLSLVTYTMYLRRKFTITTVMDTRKQKCIPFLHVNTFINFCIQDGSRKDLGFNDE